MGHHMMSMHPGLNGHGGHPGHHPGHHHMGHAMHQDHHDMRKAYGLHAKLDQADMTLNLVKSESIPSHYLYGPLDHTVAPV